MTNFIRCIFFLVAVGFSQQQLSFASDVAKGAEVYLSYGCAVCHGKLADGQGMSSQKFNPPPTNLTKKSEYRFGSDTKSMRHSIINGIKEENSVMPAFTAIAVDEMDDLMAYLMALQNKSNEVNVGQEIEVTNAFIRPQMPGQKSTAATCTISNKTNETINLTAAFSTQFKRIEIHQMFRDGGMMRMRQVKTFDIKVGEKKDFEAEGYHLMLYDNTIKLTTNDIIMIDLVFNNGRVIKVPFKVGDNEDSL